VKNWQISISSQSGMWH